MHVKTKIQFIIITTIFLTTISIDCLERAHASYSVFLNFEPVKNFIPFNKGLEIVQNFRSLMSSKYTNVFFNIVNLEKVSTGYRISLKEPRFTRKILATCNHNTHKCTILTLSQFTTNNYLNGAIDDGDHKVYQSNGGSHLNVSHYRMMLNWNLFNASCSCKFIQTMLHETWHAVFSGLHIDIYGRAYIAYVTNNTKVLTEYIMASSLSYERDCCFEDGFPFFLLNKLIRRHTNKNINHHYYSKTYPLMPCKAERLSYRANKKFTFSTTNNTCLLHSASGYSLYGRYSKTSNEIKLMIPSKDYYNGLTALAICDFFATILFTIDEYSRGTLKIPETVYLEQIKDCKLILRYDLKRFQSNGLHDDNYIHIPLDNFKTESYHCILGSLFEH